MKQNAVLAVAILALVPGFAQSEVVDSSDTGFTVKVALRIQAPPQEVYRRLIHNVGDWWNAQHTFSGNPHNLSIEERPMGCFCEKLPDGGGVRHMEVVFVAPGKRVVLRGGLGPLQAIATAGSMSIQLAPAEGGSRLDVTYAVTGYLPAGMKTWAAPVDSVLLEQFTRMKHYIETGNPAPK